MTSFKKEQIMRVEKFGNLAGHSVEMLHDDPGKHLYFPPEMAQDLRDTFKKWSIGEQKVVDCILLKNRSKDDFEDVKDPVLKEMAELLTSSEFLKGLTKQSNHSYPNKFLLERASHVYAIYFPVGSQDVPGKYFCEGRIPLIQISDNIFYIFYNLQGRDPDLDTLDVKAHMLNNIMIPVALAFLFRSTIISLGKISPEKFDRIGLKSILYNDKAMFAGDTFNLFEAIYKYFILLIKKYRDVIFDPINEKELVRSLLDRAVKRQSHYRHYLEKLPWFNFFPISEHWLNIYVDSVLDGF